jgi:hypothetical protein
MDSTVTLINAAAQLRRANDRLIAIGNALGPGTTYGPVGERLLKISVELAQVHEELVEQCLRMPPARHRTPPGRLQREEQLPLD